MPTYKDIGYNSLGIKTLKPVNRQSPQETRALTQPGAIRASTVFVGSGDSVFKADKEGIYLGNSVFADAPFSVDKDGNATLTSATLTGTVSPTGNFDMNGYDIDNAGTVTATGFVGDLTGDVVGDVTGNATTATSTTTATTATNLSGGSASMGGDIDLNQNDIVDTDAITANTINVTTLNATTISGLYTATEHWFAPIIPQWTDSWTVNSSYTDVGGSIFDINFDDLDGWDVFLDVVGKTDAGTGYYRLYNVDDATPIVGSEVTTASTTAVNIRSGAVTKPSGTKTLKVQHMISGGDEATEYVNSMMAKLVVRLSA